MNNKNDYIAVCAIWLSLAIMVYSVAGCIARSDEAKYNALKECQGTCIY